MTQLLPLLAALALTPSASLADAQPAPEVVVTGRKPATPQAAQRFVNSITQRSDLQVARFHGEICPAAIGLTDASARLVQDRIRETAVGVGAKAAKRHDCDANLILIVADNGADLVRGLEKYRPAWLAGLSPAKIRKIVNEPSAARAWAVTSLRNEDGMGMSTTGQTGNEKALQGVSMMRVMSASIVKLPTRAQIDGSVVVIDKAAATQLSLAQLADYAAMRGLARTRAPENDRIGTILGLFAPGTVSGPAEMTGADIAYLQSLYRSPGTSNAVFERARMARDIVGDRR